MGKTMERNGEEFRFVKKSIENKFSKIRFLYTKS